MIWVAALACVVAISACSGQRTPLVANESAPAPTTQGGVQPSEPTGPAVSPEPVGDFTDLGEVVLEQSLEQRLPSEKRYGEGGGMSSELMFTRLHWPSLRRCRDRIRAVADGWAKAHALVPSTVEVSDSRMMLHYGSSAPAGFFEVSYRVYAEHLATHTYFGFYDSSLRRVAPERIHSMILAFHLQQLVTDLQTAARCAEGPTL